MENAAIGEAVSLSAGAKLFAPRGAAGIPVVFLIGEGDEGAAEQARRAGGRCAICAVPVRDWNEQLSPWPGPAVFRGGGDFSGGADRFLEELLPVASEALKRVDGGRACIAGYSLAGLFALYAATRMDVFSAAAAMSASVWYDGFADYLRGHPPLNPAQRFYLSLGRAEARTRHPVLRTVEERMLEVQALLRASQRADVPLAFHDGGHHSDVPARVAAGIAWLTENG